MTAPDNYKTPPLIAEWYEILTQGRPFLPGRNETPPILWDCHSRGIFDDSPDVFAAALNCSWTDAEFPAQLLDEYDWVEMFRRAGYIENGVPTRRSRRKIPMLYRAATLGWERGMSWTDNLATARRFLRIRPGSSLWATTPDRRAVLARIHGDEGRDEDEWVLDPECLGEVVEVVDDAAGV